MQSPASSRGPRIYTDAAAYNQQLAQHQSYTAQVHSATGSPRHGPFSPGYDMQQHAYAQQQRQPSQQPQPSRSQSQSQWQPMGPPQNYQQRVPSQGLPVSSSHGALRSSNNVSMMAAATNPPPSSYYPASRNRANTINQIDAIPPALARLTHFGAPDPSGTRNLTPVMNRDDAIREWERRQQGHSKKSSLHTASYPQLEFLQEQAELAAVGGQNWTMPGQYGPAHAHRSQPSTSSHGYQMQPPIGASPQRDYRARPIASEYEPPPPASASSSQLYLPTYPPPAATSNPPSAIFDAFDSRDSTMGMMYTPLQPNQAGYHQQGYPGGHAGHQARASYSGPYHNGPNSNPFTQPQPPGPVSPRYHRRSQGYGA